jgi:hypothetical protein
MGLKLVLSLKVEHKLRSVFSYARGPVSVLQDLIPEVIHSQSEMSYEQGSNSEKLQSYGYVKAKMI